MKRNNSFNFISKIIHSINEKNNENSFLLYQANRRVNELFNKYFVFNVYKKTNLWKIKESNSDFNLKKSKNIIMKQSRYKIMVYLFILPGENFCIYM